MGIVQSLLGQRGVWAVGSLPERRMQRSTRHFKVGRDTMLPFMAGECETLFSVWEEVLVRITALSISDTLSVRSADAMGRIFVCTGGIWCAPPTETFCALYFYRSSTRYVAIAI